MLNQRECLRDNLRVEQNRHFSSRNMCLRLTCTFGHRNRLSVKQCLCPADAPCAPGYIQDPCCSQSKSQLAERACPVHLFVANRRTDHSAHSTTHRCCCRMQTLSGSLHVCSSQQLRVRQFRKFSSACLPARSTLSARSRGLARASLDPDEASQGTGELWYLP